jgi:CheY-like chemotaxis protein
MLLQIRRHPRGSIDGIRLESFRLGVVYDLGPQLASTFLAEGWAKPVNVGSVILVVDDQEDVRKFTVRLLATHGYGVVEAQDGREAIERLRECEPALVLLDLNMPVMNGWEFCAELRRLDDQRLAAIPVVLLTGEPDVDLRHQAELRAAGLVRKPFEAERLIDTIQDVLER